MKILTPVARLSPPWAVRALFPLFLPSPGYNSDSNGARDVFVTPPPFPSPDCLALKTSRYAELLLEGIYLLFSLPIVFPFPPKRASTRFFPQFCWADYFFLPYPHEAGTSFLYFRKLPVQPLIQPLSLSPQSPLVTRMELCQLRFDSGPSFPDLPRFCKAIRFECSQPAQVFDYVSRQLAERRPHPAAFILFLCRSLHSEAVSGARLFEVISPFCGNFFFSPVFF